MLFDFSEDHALRLARKRQLQKLAHFFLGQETGRAMRTVRENVKSARVMRVFVAREPDVALLRNEADDQHDHQRRHDSKADLINSDPAMDGVMKVVFVQNYNCSYAEHIIPAADVSEQISPAGTEASGTGNMKLMLNGAVTLGTLDGANVEIAEQAGSENEYIFGATVEEINMVKPNYNARSFYEANPNLRRAVDTLIDGTVPTDEEQHELYTSLLKGASWHKPDQYFIFYDFDSYKKARLRVNHDYCDRIAFGRKCLMNVASAGKFSSDRTIRQYAEDIWHIQPVK